VINLDKRGRFIILRKTRYSEADLILQALSQQGGKLSFIARGALKSKKRFGGGILEPLNYVEFVYGQGKDQNLNILKEAQIIEDFEKIKVDYDRIEFALKTLEIVGKVCQEGDDQSKDLFNLLGHSLRALNSTNDLAVLQLQFYLKFLAQQGVLNIEPWMTPFLKTQMQATDLLHEHSAEALSQLNQIRLIVGSYIQNAGV
jgi:DNA repair protein RecO (recombination protein O)